MGLGREIEMSKGKLVLIDGHALAYRAYFALPPTLSTSKGELTNAVFGFTSMLLNVLRDEKPDYIAVTFDVGKTFRHEEYKEYKAHRVKMPDDMRIQMARIREIIQAMNIPVIEVDGYEADDVLGTLAQKAEKEGVEILIVTGDTDTFQLIDDHTRVLTSRRAFSDTVVYDLEGIEERYGLQPHQLIDYKALVGDTSDNIPGVRGIGDKTATQLLQRYGNVEGIYAHLDEVESSRFRNALEDGRRSAFLSKFLAAIVTDVPIELDLESCRVAEFDLDKVKELFRELEFRTLLNRLPSEARPEMKRQGPPQQLTLFGEVEKVEEEKPIPIAYQVVADEKALGELVARLAKAAAITLDVETTSTDAMVADLVGIALTDREGAGYYVPVGKSVDRETGKLVNRETGKSVDWETGKSGNRSTDLPIYQSTSLPVYQSTNLPIYQLDKLRPVLENESIAKYAHNSKYDLTVLVRHGAQVKGLAFDTMIAEWLADPGSRNLGLKNLAWARLGVEMQPISDLIGSGKGQLTMAQVSIAQVAHYACSDVDMTHRLVKVLEPELRQKELWPLFTEVEMPLVPVLVEMEMKGVKLDVEYLGEMSRQLRGQLVDLEREIQEMAGYPFNINSTQQLSDALFIKLGLSAQGVRKTESGHYSTSADVLERLRGQHPVVELILEQRELAKLKSTYVDALPLLVNKDTGRVHTSYNQTGTVTGRLSSSDPNLQNIPIRTDVGREVRRAFVAEEGSVLLAADYSQVELRILAHISQDERLLDAFSQGEDIHASTAATVLNVPIEEVTPEMRRFAKCVAKGTLVHTSRGIRPIEAVGEKPGIGQFTPLGDLSVVSDESEKKATHLYYDGCHPVRKIIVRTGLAIACTSRHKLRVVNKAGDYVWKAAGEIECGDYLAVIRGSRVFGNDYELPEVEFPPTLKVTNYKDLDIPSYWTPELARFLGYVISEGYLYRHKTKPRTGHLTLSQSLAEEEITKDLIKVTRALFGDRTKISQHRGSIFVQINSSKLLYWLKSLGIYGKADTKAVPDALLVAPYEIQVEFLRALFSGDGSLKSKGKQITYSTKSQQLATRLQQILLNFGYLFSLSAEKRKDRDEAYYALSLTGVDDIQSFFDEIGFISEHKQAPGQTVFLCDRSAIPYQTERIRELYPFLKGAVRDKAYEVLRDNQPVNLNHVRAEMIVGYLRSIGVENPALTELEKLVSKNLVFLPVVDIEEGEADVYDLFVPDGNTYVANGFVSHNTVNFGITYGMSGYGMAQRTGLSQEESDRFIREYFARYPKVKAYLDETKRKARDVGYVETLLGRRRYFPELKSGSKAHQNVRASAQRMAINAPIQGSAADIIKIAMIRLHRALKERGLRSSMTLQVHDELVLEVPEGELDVVAPLVKSIMEGAFQLDAPLKVDTKVGRNWLEME